MIAMAFAFVVALVHFYVFFLESVAWGRPATNRLFGVREPEAEANRVFAFNQGFYNLFLALAIVAGLLLRLFHREVEGTTLLTYACLSVFGAGFVLFLSSPGRARPAAIQALPAIGYLGFSFLGY